MESSLNAVLDRIKTTQRTLNNVEIMSLLDLTLLDETATEYDVKSLTAKASQHKVAAVCVYPQHLGFIPAGIPLTRATVINFPQGNASLKEVMKSLRDTLHQENVQEMDYVFPYHDYLQGNRQEALDHCNSVHHFCHDHGLIFKVILETGTFPSLESMYQLSSELIQQGCDFLKTSTGQIPQGASTGAAYAILSAIKDSKISCGIKLSGGIRTKQQALEYIHLAEFMLKKKVDKHWFRIGASSLLDELLQ